MLILPGREKKYRNLKGTQGSCCVALPVKTVNNASIPDALVENSFAPLLIQLSVDAPGKSMEDDPSASAPVPTWDKQMKLPDPDLALAVAAVSFRE